MKTKEHVTTVQGNGTWQQSSKKLFWDSNKDLKYWKVRPQGRYKELKIAPVYPQPQFVGVITLPQERIDKLMDNMNLSDEESDHGRDD